MFIPIVRRTVTVRVREVQHFPFQCDFCKLATWGHVFTEATGSATTAYVRPDENTARDRARLAAQRAGAATFSQTPCPRCGTPPLALRMAQQAWEQKAVTRKKTRFWALMVGFAVTLLFSAGCGLLCALQGDDGSVQAGVTLGIVWLVLGAGASALLYALLGPGRRPAAYGFIPQNVRFDPPDPSQVQGNYRSG